MMTNRYDTDRYDSASVAASGQGAAASVHSAAPETRSAGGLSLVEVNDPRLSECDEKPLAILFCDIRQYTPFVDTHPPREVFHILNRFYSAFGEPILRHDGFIYQYVGDQIVGLFGLQGASPEESGLNAVRAGLGMIAALEALNEELEPAFGVRLDVRIGAHVGPLVAGYLGHPMWPQFCVVGDAMNVTSRIEGANKALGTTFLVSEALYDHLPIPVVEGQRARIPLKGKGGLHTLIEVLAFETYPPACLAPNPAGQRSGLHGLSPTRRLALAS